MRVPTPLYVAIALVLCAFGFLAILSIGAPIFLTGAAMLAAAPWRHRRGVLGPVLLGVWGFVGAYVLLAPLGCSSSARPAEPGTAFVEHTSCTNVLGIDYSGVGAYDPPLLPALLAGLAAGLAVAVGTRRLFRADRRARARP